MHSKVLTVVTEEGKGVIFVDKNFKLRQILSFTLNIWKHKLLPSYLKHINLGTISVLQDCIASIAIALIHCYID